VKKTQKKQKQKKKILTKSQIDLIFNKFYGSMESNVLGLVFDDKDEKIQLMKEMISFVSQKILNDLKFPATDDKIEEKIAEIMKEEGKSMAQDLIYNQVKSTIENIPSCSKKECSGCKHPKNNDFNKKRGIG